MNGGFILHLRHYSKGHYIHSGYGYTMYEVDGLCSWRRVGADHMITGHVEKSHALLPITFRRISSSDLSIEFIVDTGFTGFLTLSPAAVIALQLPYLEDVSANLANDTHHYQAGNSAAAISFSRGLAASREERVGAVATCQSTSRSGSSQATPYSSSPL